jgi:hypothetical protein
LTFTHLAGVQFSSPTGARRPAASRNAGVPPNFGGHSEGETPLPIPNRAVKPLSADGTWCSRAWESRSPPVLSSPRAAPRGGSSRFEAGSTRRLAEHPARRVCGAATLAAAAGPAAGPRYRKRLPGRPRGRPSRPVRALRGQRLGHQSVLAEGGEVDEQVDSAQQPREAPAAAGSTVAGGLRCDHAGEARFGSGRNTCSASDLAPPSLTGRVDRSCGVAAGPRRARRSRRRRRPPRQPAGGAARPARSRSPARGRAPSRGGPGARCA